MTGSMHQRSDALLSNPNSGFHTSIKPYVDSEVQAAINRDSIIESLYTGNKKSLLNDVLSRNIIDKQTENVGFVLNPVLTGQVGYGNDLLSSFQAGASFNLDLGTKWSLGSTFYSSINRFPDHMRTYAYENRVAQGRGFATELGGDDSAGIGSRYFDARLSYAPSKHFHIQVGNGKNFIGDGYRSLLLSDNSNSYPFLRINTKIWKVNYLNLFMNLKDVTNSSSYFDSKNKYVSLHYLSLNITKRINLGVFEGVVFESRDTTKAVGFDFNYLNPIIFFRPVEYAQGSADNVILGLSMKYKLFKKQQLYFQVVVDEFLKDSIFSRNGWWANKYGFQLGFKSFDVLKVNGLKIQGEINVVRPYTYSHSQVSQNYGHFNQPLAHPLGANFMEGVGIARYDRNRWGIEGRMVLAEYGLNDSLNYGKDIFISNRYRAKENGVEIGQGVKEKLLVSELGVTYLINPISNFGLELKFVNRTTITVNKSYNFVMFGIRTNIINRYYDI